MATDIQSADSKTVRAVYLRCPANDNALAEACALTLADVHAISREHAAALGAAMDDALSDGVYTTNLVRRALGIAIGAYPAVQRAMVQRGSWLSQTEVDALSTNDLLLAMGEVVAVTRASYEHGEERAAFFKEVMPFSCALRAVYRR